MERRHADGGGAVPQFASVRERVHHTILLSPSAIVCYLIFTIFFSSWENYKSRTISSTYYSNVIEFLHMHVIYLKPRAKRAKNSSRFFPHTTEFLAFPFFLLALELSRTDWSDAWLPVQFDALHALSALLIDDSQRLDNWSPSADHADWPYELTTRSRTVSHNVWSVARICQLMYRPEPPTCTGLTDKYILSLPVIEPLYTKTSLRGRMQIL